MSRKWLLGLLTGLVLTLAGAVGASAAEAQALDDPVTVGADGVGSVTVDAGTEEPSLTVEADSDVAVEDGDTTVDETAEVQLSPDGAEVDLDGDTEVGGEDVPLDEATDPVEDAVSGIPPEDLQEPGSDTGAAADEVRTAPAPAPAPAPAGGSHAPAPAGPRVAPPVSADRAAARAGIASVPAVPVPAAPPAPEVAPPVLAAAPAQRTELAVPVVDTTPTVPALLRLLAGLMVLGAGATWRTVSNRL